MSLAHSSNKTTTIYKQNPVCTGFYIMSDFNDVLESGNHDCLLGYDNVDLFVDEVMKKRNELLL